MFNLNPLQNQEQRDEPKMPSNMQTVETGYTPPQNQDVRWMFDYTEFMLDIKAKLYGGLLIPNKKGELVIKHKREAMMLNEFGIDQTMAIIGGYVDKIHALSQMDEERILQLCKNMATQLNFFYFINMEKFDITPDRAAIVIDMILYLFEANMRKSMNAQTLKLIGQTERFSSTVQLEPPKKKFLWF